MMCDVHSYIILTESFYFTWFQLNVGVAGGSIGSALAILTFYPLERIRVELQSNSARIEHANECTKNDGNIDSSLGKSDCSLDKREVLDDVGDDDTIIQQEEVNHPALDFLDKSFDLVSPLKTIADDVESLDTSLEDDQEDIDTSLATNEHILHSNTVLDEDLDQVKTPKNPLSKYEPDIRQTSKSYSQENILQCFVRLHKEQTLYKGASHMVITMMVSNAVFFYTLQVIRQRMSSLQQKSSHNQNFLPKSKMGRSLLASSIAGAINVLMTNPLWVASLRIMESKLPQHGNDDRSKKPTLWSVMHQIAAKEGIANLWSGTNTSLLLVSNPIIQHFLYEQLRLWILESRQRRSRSRHTRQQDPRLVSKATSLSPLEALAFGALAKAVATVVVCMQMYRICCINQTYRISNTKKSFLFALMYHFYRHIHCSE